MDKKHGADNPRDRYDPHEPRDPFDSSDLYDPYDPFFDRENVVSAMECTGLMPSLPCGAAEDEAAAALYAIHDEGDEAPPYGACDPE